MAYDLKWNKNHPGLLTYLIDMSGSMSLNSRKDYVFETISAVAEYLIGYCEDNNGNPLDLFKVKIIVYNTDHAILFDGSVVELDQKLEEAYTKNIPLCQTFENAQAAEPKWQTYTAKAFRFVAKEIKSWIDQQNARNIPIPAPIVIHITDGHPEEKERDEVTAISDAVKAAQELKSIAVADGNTLLFNIHIDEKTGKALRFPSIRPSGDTKEARRLQFMFDASSEMTDSHIRRILGLKMHAEKGSRFMVSNESDKNILARIIEFGSSVALGGDFVELPKY